MTIYTKRGDGGETALYDKESRQNIRVSKASLKIGAIGGLDELNSYLGVVVSSSQDSVLTSQLKNVQRDLLSIGSIVAGSNLRFFASKTRRLEKEIDKLEGSLPVLKNFVLPGGTPVAAQMHYARTLARRAERKVVALNRVERVSARGRSLLGRRPQILVYLNRLSDYLFMLARKVNHDSGIKEEVWKGKE